MDILIIGDIKQILISLSSSQCKKHGKASVAIKLNRKVTWSFSTATGIRKRCAVFASATDE